jgi:thiamine transport system ATP-binding protein
LLKITNLTYTYEQNSKQITYDFSCQVKKGEIVGIMGESGSGKSTFLDLVAGFLTQKSGNITFENKHIEEISTEKRPLTILFQNYNVFEHLSVLKNILLGANGKMSNEVKEILKEVGLGGFEDKLVSSLSGGQMQRVALARSLIRKTPILLLDEPFNGLDIDTRVKMLNLVKSITKKRNLCTIMVTHDLHDCNLIANRIYTVKNGKFIE